LHLVQRPKAPESAELYNLEEDPSERFDFAAKHPEQVSALRAEIERHVASVKRGEPQA
jgi:hypothetical protein